MFKDGATPSRLVRRILLICADEHGREQDRIVRAYFREAFGIPLFRASAELLDAPPEKLLFAGYGGQIIQEIVARRNEWDRNPSRDPSWLDAIPPMRSNSGAPFDEDTFRRVIANCDQYREKSEILSYLVERLQEQVLALEQSQGTPVTPRPPLAVAG